jgi:hypothetical protein
MRHIWEINLLFVSLGLYLPFCTLLLTLLSLGCLFYIAKNPDILVRLTRLIRETYTQESEMDSKGLSRLPYLTAVLEESLRIYPSVASSTPRVTPLGGSNSMSNRVITPFFTLSTYQRRPGKII